MDADYLPNISDAEWEIMKVLWKQSPRTANEIEAGLGHTRWNPKTVRSLINRLVKKKAVTFEREGRQYKYHPAVSEEECIRSETKSFISRVNPGGVRGLKPMIAAFIEEQKLSAEEIEELKQILDNKRS